MATHHTIKKDFGSHQTRHHYVNLKPQTVLCHVVQLKDAVNYDIHLLDSPDLDLRYQEVISNQYVYQIGTRKNLMRPMTRTGTVYRARLSGVVVRDEREMTSPSQRETFSAKKIKMMQEIQAQMVRWVNMTGGIFTCEACSIDIYDRVLVRLYDPVTGLSVNDYLLINYPDLFMSYKCTMSNRA